MPAASISQADLATIVVLAIPLALAALTMLFAAALVTALAGCAAAEWTMRRANRVVLASVGES